MTMNVQTFSFLPLAALAGASGLFAFAFRGERPQSVEALAGALCLTTLATLFYWIHPCPGSKARKHCLIGWVCCKLKKRFHCGCACACEQRECFSRQKVCSPCSPCTPCSPCSPRDPKKTSPPPTYKKPVSPASVVSLGKEAVCPPSPSSSPSLRKQTCPSSQSFKSTHSGLSACPPDIESELSFLEECPPEPPKPVRGGAVLLFRKVPDVEILHLAPNNWCVTTSVAEDDDEKIRAAAEEKILAATGLRPEEIKVFPDITKNVSFQTKKTKKQVNVAYRLAEAHPLAEVKADHAWLTLEQAVQKTSGCEELAELLKAFHVTALERESQWTLDYEALDAKAALAQGKVGQWYRDSEKKDTLYRVLERKKKTIQFQLVHPRSDSLCGSSRGSSRGSLGSSVGSLRMCADQGQSGENCYCPTLPRTRCQRAVKWILGFVVVALVAAAVTALVVYRRDIF